MDPQPVNQPSSVLIPAPSPKPGNNPDKYQTYLSNARND